MRPGVGGHGRVFSVHEARWQEAQAQGGKLGREGGAGGSLCIGGTWGGLPRFRLFPGVGDGWMDGRAEVLWLFGVTFQVGGRWVWPSRANEQWGPWAAPPNRPPKSDALHLLQTAPCTRAWMKWPRSPRSSFVAQSKMTRYDTPTRTPLSYLGWIGVIPTLGLTPRPRIHPCLLIFAV